MIKYPLPLILPAGTIVEVSQPFGVTDVALEPVGPQGQPHFHYGVDLIWKDALLMFGTPLVLPAEGSTENAYMMPPGSLSATPFVSFAFTGASGNKYVMTLAHCSAIYLAQQYGKGQIVALVGNYGDLSPQPTIDSPFNGTHLHLGLQCNGEWVNPLDYFDITKFTTGALRDPNNCTPRINWACQQVEAQLQALVAAAK